jgi:hypothetical protein
MSKPSTTEYEELSINTVTGLRAFLQNVEKQHSVGVEKVSRVPERQKEEYISALQHAFQTVRHTTNKLISTVESGGEVNGVDAASLQGDYDELVRVIYRVPKSSQNQSVKTATVVQPAPKQSAHSSKHTAPNRPKTKPAMKAKKTTERANPPAVTSIKPRTGALSINSDDGEVIDVKNRVHVASGATSAQSAKTSLASVPVSGRRAGDFSWAPLPEAKKLHLVIQKSKQRLAGLQKKYPNPSLEQDLLLAEATEGIEHLELIAKNSNFKKEQLLSISEVASHIKHALDSVAELGAGTRPTESRVPIVTDQVTKKDSPGHQAVSFVPTSVTTRKTAVPTRRVPKELQTLPKPDDLYKQESLTKKYLTAQPHLQFLQAHYSSPAGFEQVLDATITKIEADTIDSIEKWLGDLPASAFGFLKDMSVPEVIAFSNRSYHEVTADLQQQNVKYETFSTWRDMLNDMLEIVPNGQSMNFGELYAHFMIALAMEEMSE